MAECDQLDGRNAGLLRVFARTPRLCAGALAGLGSALRLNVVGPFAGLVAAWGALTLVNTFAVVLMAVLAILVIAAGSLVAADWRADVASREAWAKIDIAAAELNVPAEAAALSQIGACYLAATDNDELRGLFRAHRVASPMAAPEARARSPAAAPPAQIVVEATGSFPQAAASDAVPKVAHKISTASVSDGATDSRKTARAMLAQEAVTPVSSRAGRHAERAASTARLAANGGIWSDWFLGDRSLARAPPKGQSANIIVLSGDPSDRHRYERFLGPSTDDSAAKSDKPPSCRGSPSAIGQRSCATETAPDERSAKHSSNVLPIGALRSVDPVVHDNLAHQVPVCAAELDVIETYLDQVLLDLLASGTPVPDREKS